MANPDDSKHSKPTETIEEFFAKVGSHLGPSPTREEKLAALRIYVSEEEAQEVMRESGFIDVGELEELLAAAATREEKMAVLSKYYPEDEAHEEMRLIDLKPLIEAAPTREARLAILRQHLPEEGAQGYLRYLARKESDKTPNEPHVAE